MKQMHAPTRSAHLSPAPPPVLASLLADLVVAVHLLFIAFVLFGGLLVRRWPMASWVHLPAVLWAVMIEVLGIPSPLAPLERWLRERGGGEGIDGGEGGLVPARGERLFRRVRVREDDAYAAPRLDPASRI